MAPKAVQAPGNPFKALEMEEDGPSAAARGRHQPADAAPAGPGDLTRVPQQRQKRKGQHNAVATAAKTSTSTLTDGTATQQPSTSAQSSNAQSAKGKQAKTRQQPVATADGVAPPEPRKNVKPASQPNQQKQDEQHTLQANGRAHSSNTPTLPTKQQPQKQQTLLHQQHQVAMPQPSAPAKQRGRKRALLVRSLCWLAVLAGMAWMVHQENVKLGLHHTDVSVAGINVSLPVPTMEVPVLPNLANITSELTDLQAQLATKLATLYASVSVSNITSATSLLPDWMPSLPKEALSRDGLDRLLNQLPGFSSSAQEGSSTGTQQGKLRPGQVLASRGLKAKHPVVIVPGFITSQLELWQGHPCAARYFRQRMWGTLSMMQVFLRSNACWLEHIGLDLVTGLDPPGVKLRAAQGLEAVDFFIQGYWVWGKMVEALADVGYDTNNMATMAYDWRLAIPQMEARDAWFTRTRHTIEMLASVTNEKAVIVSHSYGENVARTFLHWAEGRQPGWVEQYVHAHVAVAGPTLGVPKALTSLLSGETYDTAQLGGLAAFLTDKMMPRHTRARLFRSWPSVLAMLPVGGPKVWGNTSWAPDDTPEMLASNRSYGALITSAPLRDKPKNSDGSSLPTPNSTTQPTIAEPAELSDVTDTMAAAAELDAAFAEAMCEGSTEAGVEVTQDPQEGIVSVANITTHTKCTVKTSAGGSAGEADSNSSTAESSAAQAALTDASADSSSGGLVDTVKNWFTVSDERAAPDLLDMSQLHQMHVGTALKLGLRIAGPLMTHHFQQWGAVHGPDANKPPQTQPQDKQDVDDMVRESGFDDNETDNSQNGAGGATAMPGPCSSKGGSEQASTAGRSKQQHKQALPLFPNALTTPLPPAPSLQIVCLYGVGLPTERAYHYIQPDDWHPSELDQPEPDVTELIKSSSSSSSSSSSNGGGGIQSSSNDTQDSPNGTQSSNSNTGPEIASSARGDHSPGAGVQDNGLDGGRDGGQQGSSGHGGQSSTGCRQCAGRDDVGRECPTGWNQGFGDAAEATGANGSEHDGGSGVDGGSSQTSDGMQELQRARHKLEGRFDWRINTALDDPATGLDNGVEMDTGDVTVPLLSLGGMCRGGWKSKRLNPAGMQVITREYQHVAASQPRGGSTSGQHIDILGNEELLTDVLLVATGVQLEDRVVTHVDEVVARIPWEEPDGWDWTAQTQTFSANDRLPSQLDAAATAAPATAGPAEAVSQ